jgi:hypothetical protein
MIPGTGNRLTRQHNRGFQMPGRPFQRGNNRARKLRPEEALAIREKYLIEGGYTQSDLSRIYGVSVNQIGRIIAGTAWQGIAGSDLVGRDKPPADRQVAVDLPSDEELTKRLQARLENYEPTKFVIPSLDDGAPTGIGLDKLNSLAEKELKVGNELEQFTKQGD